MDVWSALLKRSGKRLDLDAYGGNSGDGVAAHAVGDVEAVVAVGVEGEGLQREGLVGVREAVSDALSVAVAKGNGEGGATLRHGGGADGGEGVEDGGEVEVGVGIGGGGAQIEGAAVGGEGVGGREKVEGEGVAAVPCAGIDGEVAVGGDGGCGVCSFARCGEHRAEEEKGEKQGVLHVLHRQAGFWFWRCPPCRRRLSGALLRRLLPLFFFFLRTRSKRVMLSWSSRSVDVLLAGVPSSVSASGFCPSRFMAMISKARRAEMVCSLARTCLSVE